MSFTSIAEAAPPATGVKEIMQKPLIIGASVSGDFLTPSPGKRLALRYTSADKIKVKAQNGKPGREVLKSVTEEMIKDRTVIIGVDLFFWDSFQGSLPESLKALERLQTLASKFKIPLVLAEIPELSPQYQPSASTLNKRIRESCKSENLCRVLPLNAMLRQVLRDGFITQGGVRYPLRSLLPDGLHISEPASEYLADRLQELF